MALEHIENKTFAEIKAEWDALLAEVVAAPHEAVSERYLQARMDAKQRDEKLAEQGQAILVAEAAASQANDLAQVAEAEIESLRAQVEKLKAEVAALKQQPAA